MTTVPWGATGHLISVWQWQDASTIVRGDTFQGRVLVVEDDDAVRTMLITVLEVAGYEVRGAGSGEEALTTVRQWRPDVIALDVLMSNMEGYHFLAERSRQPDLAGIPVIVVTVSTASLPPPGQLGVQAVLQQPHDIDHLRTLIAEAILDSATRGSVGDQLH
jgi:CheY-like chemotaxis protein